MYWLPSFADAEPVLRELLGAGDVCVVMGAGDVDDARAAGWWRDACARAAGGRRSASYPLRG